MAFKPIKYDSGKVVELNVTASKTIAKHDGLDFSSGYAQRATSGTTNVQYVALQAVVTGAGEAATVLAVPTDGVYFECDTNGNTSQALEGTFIDLTDHDTLNEGASTTNAFKVTEIVGAAADKKVRGYFNNNIS